MTRGHLKKNPSAQFDLVIDALFSDATDKVMRSAISREEGRFLRSLASEAEVQTTIEVGCAFALSALYICSGISSKKDPRHTAIDPFQTSEFQGRGVENVRSAGFDFFSVIEQPSELALPALLSSGASYDLALIDGLHTADQTLLDFYFLDRMIRVGGIIVFDDVSSSAVNKVVRYVSTYPNYELIGTSGGRGIKRRLTNVLKQWAAIALWPVRKVFGEALCREFFDISLVHPETIWSIDFCTMAAFRKLAEIERDTDWYKGI